MNIIDKDMIDCFPFLLSEGVLSQEEIIKRRFKPDNFGFDKDKHCYLINGGEVYVHTIDYCGRPNACQHCMFRFKVRMGLCSRDGIKILASACPAITMCKVATRKARQMGKSVFLQSTENFSLGKDDVITKEVCDA